MDLEDTQEGKKRGRTDTDSDESVLVGNIAPRGRTTARARNAGPVRACCSCKQEWPSGLAWPPPAVKVINGKKITIEDDEVEEQPISENTRSVRRRLGNEITTSGTTVETSRPVSNDLMDLVGPAEGRTNEKRLENLQTLVDALYDRSKDIPNIANILRGHVTRIENTVAAEAQRKEQEALQRAAAAQEQRRRTAAIKATAKAVCARKSRQRNVPRAA